jgi:hypothetical protein
MNIATPPNGLRLFGARDPLASLWEDRQVRIQKCAYFKALKRSFFPGGEFEDWLAAEQEVDEAIRLTQED